MKLPDIDWSKFLLQYRFQLFFSLLGLMLLVMGIIFFKSGQSFRSSEVEILSNNNSLESAIVEVAGAVINPGVYELKPGARIEDALIAAGGFSQEADRVWIEKMINQAALVKDGQKIYIPKEDEQSDLKSAANFGEIVSNEGGVLSLGEGLINVNTASQKELEALVGIGPVYAQNIIEHRPYSTVEELVSKSAINKSVFEKIKNQITIY